MNCPGYLETTIATFNYLDATYFASEIDPISSWHESGKMTT